MKLSTNIEKNKGSNGVYDITGALRYAAMLQSMSDENVIEYAFEVIDKKHHWNMYYIHNLRKQLMVWYYGPDILLFEQFDELRRTCG